MYPCSDKNDSQCRSIITRKVYTFVICESEICDSHPHGYTVNARVTERSHWFLITTHYRKYWQAITAYRKESCSFYVWVYHLRGSMCVFKNSQHTLSKQFVETETTMRSLCLDRWCDVYTQERKHKNRNCHNVPAVCTKRKAECLSNYL